MKSTAPRCVFLFFFLAIPLLGPSPAAADGMTASIHAGHCCCCCGNDLWTRDKLTGDLWGARSCLAQHGIVYDAQLTQFYQGVTSGGQEETFRYGGKLDQFVLFDFERLGLCKRLRAAMHVETRFGESVIGDAAPLAPVNASMLYPEVGEHDTAITGLQFEYGLTEQLSLTFGKINAMDLFYTVYPQSGRGIDGFMNASLVLPLTVGRTVPLSFLGAGLLKRRGPQIQGGLLVYDSNNTPTTSGFDELFDNGANIAGLWRFFTECHGRPGSHLFLGTWASGDYTSLDPLDWIIIPAQGIVAPEQTGSWCLVYVMEQQLWADRCNKNRNVGLLGVLGLADPDTNPFEWTADVKLQGQGLLRCRQRDTMGVGYFYNGLSSDFKRLVNVLPTVDVEDVQGVELYYNATLTPWCHLTTDLQIIDNQNVADDTAIILGLRANVKL